MIYSILFRDVSFFMSFRIFIWFQMISLFDFSLPPSSPPPLGPFRHPPRPLDAGAAPRALDDRQQRPGPPERQRRVRLRQHIDYINSIHIASYAHCNV